MIPIDVKSLVELVRAGTGGDATSRALLILLKNSSDSSHIVEALADIDPQLIGERDLRIGAAELLEKADAYEASKVWRAITEIHQTDDQPSTNIVSLRPGSAPAAEATHYGQVVTFDEVGGLDKVKRQIHRKIIRPFENPGMVAKFKRKAGGGVLLYGPPGCGKTMIARAVANEVKAEFTEVRAAEVLDRYIGVAEGRIAEIFEHARANRPHVLFFDEVEALAQRRQFDSGYKVNTVVSVLLTEMDSDRNEGILMLGATNLPWSLDSAFRRPGRFDRTLFVPPPDKVAREFILKRLLEGRPVSDLLDMENLVMRTGGFSGADLESLVETSVDYALDSSLSPENITLITNEHFEDAFDEVKSTTREWLSEARNFGEYANQSGMYDDLRDFLKKHARQIGEA
ncbi:MAG: ATP-binding protein [Henriciella sp.]|jgi:SpoVK/Ycf46/Vps4 family AAA+-type ATPase